MFRDDHILRMIEQATAAIARIIGLKDARRYPQALAEIDQTLQRFWGLSSDTVGLMSAEALMALARRGERLDIGKLVVLTDLLQAEGDVYAAQDMTPWSADRYLKALDLLLELAFLSDETNWPELAPRIRALVDRLGSTETPSETNGRLAYFLERVEQSPGAASA